LISKTPCAFVLTDRDSVSSRDATLI